MKPEVGHWLYASCSASDYGQIVAVGEDDNGHPTIDIRLSDPQDLVTCDENGTNGWSDSLTTLEIAGKMVLDVRLILRNVQWRPGGDNDGSGSYIICNTPGSECFRCTKLFQLRNEPAKPAAKTPAQTSANTELLDLLAEVERLDKSATPGPWYAVGPDGEHGDGLAGWDRGDDGYTIGSKPNIHGWENDSGCTSYSITKEDAEFAARARTLLPLLAKELSARLSGGSR